MPNTSPGYSITVRVEAPAVAHATAALTTAVSSAGGALTALDVAESHADRIVVDVTCDASDVDHADRITEALAQVPGVTVRKVSDRTFLIHLGGKIEVTPKVAAQAPRRPLPRLHPGRRPRLPGDRGEPRGRPPAHHQAQHRGRGHRRVRGARPGQHRRRGGAAGDGGQGGAVQAVRRRRRVAGLPRHPGHRPDRRDRAGHRPRVRRDQPGGHLGAAVLRDRGPAARAARHPGVPRRPARHRDRRARRPDQRPAGRRQAAAGRLASWCPVSAPPGTRSSGCCTPRAPASIIGCDRHGAVHAGQPERDEFRAWIATHTNLQRRQGTLKEVLAGADVFVGVSGAQPADRRGHRHDGARTRSSSPSPTPTPRSTRWPPASTPPSSPPGRSDYPNQINNVLAFPGFFRGLLDAGASDITDAMMIAAATAIADAVEPDELNPTYIVPSVFDPGGGARRSPRPSGRWPCPRAAPAPRRPARATGTPGERPGRRARRAARRGGRSAWRGTTRARRPGASRCTPSTSPPTATPPTRCERWRLEATAVLDRHAATAADAPGGVRHRRRVGRAGARPGARQARARAGRGPADRLRGRLRRPRRRRGGPGGRHGGDGAAPYRRGGAGGRRSAASGSRASRRRPGGAGCARWSCSSTTSRTAAGCRTGSW